MGKPRWVNKLFRETSWLVQKNNLTNHGHISKMPGWDHIMCPSFSSLSRGSAAAAVPWALKNPTKCTQRSPTTRAIPFGRVWIPMIHEGWLIFIAGWWFGTMEFYDFPFSWEEIYNPNWRSHIFHRGRLKPPTRLSHMITIIQRVTHEGWLIFIALPSQSLLWLATCVFGSLAQLLRIHRTYLVIEIHLPRRRRPSAMMICCRAFFNVVSTWGWLRAIDVFYCFSMFGYVLSAGSYEVYSRSIQFLAVVFSILFADETN